MRLAAELTAANDEESANGTAAPTRARLRTSATRLIAAFWSISSAKVSAASVACGLSDPFVSTRSSSESVSADAAGQALSLPDADPFARGRNLMRNVRM